MFGVGGTCAALRTAPLHFCICHLSALTMVQLLNSLSCAVLAAQCTYDYEAVGQCFSTPTDSATNFMNNLPFPYALGSTANCLDPSSNAIPGNWRLSVLLWVISPVFMLYTGLVSFATSPLVRAVPLNSVLAAHGRVRPAVGGFVHNAVQSAKARKLSCLAATCSNSLQIANCYSSVHVYLACRCQT